MRIEAQALAKIAHPNLVQVTDFGQTAHGRTFLVMERLRGRNLREELEQRKFLPVLEAMNIVRQSLQGLAAAHDAGIVHRDVKLENLFLCEGTTNRRNVKVLDFGVAKVIGVAGENTPLPLAFPTAEGVAMGTPRYFSPEQARGREVDWRTDVYASGIVLYTLVTGRGPFDHHSTLLELTRAHAFEQPATPSSIAPQVVPPELDAAIAKALAKEPLDRFPTAFSFAVELERISAKLSAEQRSQTASVPPPPETPQVEPPTRPTAQLGTSEEELEATIQKFPARVAVAVPLPHAPSEETTLPKFPRGVAAASLGQTNLPADSGPAPSQSEPEPATVRVEGSAVAAAVAAATLDEETGAITQRIAAPVLKKLRQSAADPVPSQPAPTTRQNTRAIPAEAVPDKPAVHSPTSNEEPHSRDTVSFADLDAPVPTDPSGGQTSHDAFADTPVANADTSAPNAPVSIPIVAPGSLVKSDSDHVDDAGSLNESGERHLTFAGRVAEHAEHAAGSTGKFDRALIPTGGRKDRTSALPGRGPGIAAIPGRKDRISALPGRPGSMPDIPVATVETAEPKRRPAPSQTPAQVHIPGPPAASDDASAGALRPLKAPVPWRVRRTAPGASRAHSQQGGGQALDNKPDNTRLYYTIIVMITLIGAATFIILRLIK
jgi:serine/threonine-protein kinase